MAVISGFFLAAQACAAPARLQSLVDLPGGPTLEEGTVVVNDGGPNPLQITANVQGTTPLTHFQVQFEGRKGGARVHYQICNFTTDATGAGACHFNNNVGRAAAIVGNAVPLDSGGIITPGPYSPIFVVVCPFSVPPADAPDLFVSNWSAPGIVVP
jgi:hypothetical protein